MAGDAQNYLQRLTDGNFRFAAGNMEHPRLNTKARQETLEQGQKPFAAVLSCSDSRVPVEIIFDQGIGDIFSIRNAGNVCDEVSVGTLELGVHKFEIPLFAVLGHTDCGAVKLALEDAGLSGKMPRVIHRVRPAVKRAMLNNPELEGENLVLEITKENARLSAREFVESSALLRDRIESGQLQVAAGVYYLENGEVEWFDLET